MLTARPYEIKVTMAVDGRDASTHSRLATTACAATRTNPRCQAKSPREPQPFSRLPCRSAGMW